MPPVKQEKPFKMMGFAGDALGTVDECSWK
jgi:hypothetical protein